MTPELQNFHLGPSALNITDKITANYFQLDVLLWYCRSIIFIVLLCPTRFTD